MRIQLANIKIRVLPGFSQTNTRRQLGLQQLLGAYFYYFATSNYAHFKKFGII